MRQLAMSVAFELPTLADVEERRQGFPLCDDICTKKQTFTKMLNVQETMTRPDYVIGIDPDVERSGYALIDMETKKVSIETVALPALIDMVDSIQSTALATDKRLTVYVEAGWLNVNNWHLGFRDSKAQAAAKGKSVGRNHQRGMDICELLAYRGISVVQVPPLKKVWRGPDRKITQEELTAIIGQVKHTNQEGRDAALLAWYHAGLPMRMKRRINP